MIAHLCNVIYNTADFRNNFGKLGTKVYVNKNKTAQGKWVKRRQC